jgi:hypothetical protein
LYEILKSFGRRVSLIKLQRIEERFSAVKEIMLNAVCVCVCARACARACLNRKVLSSYFRYLNGQEVNAVQEAFADFPFGFFQIAKDGHTYLKGLIDSVLYY